MPNGGDADCPDDINAYRIGAVLQIIRHMCEDESQANEVESIVNKSLMRDRLPKRLRHMPYWIQVLVREAEEIAGEAHKHHVSAQDVIAWRTYQHGRQASEFRRWYQNRHKDSDKG